ncbi:MAG: hypothetical protein RL095_526 [Verrucomicrobiota bacterium]
MTEASNPCRCKECQVEIMALTFKANKGFCRKCRSDNKDDEDDGWDQAADWLETLKLIGWGIGGAWLGWKLLGSIHWLLGLIAIPCGFVTAIGLVILVDIILLFTCGIFGLGGLWLVILIGSWVMEKFRRPDPQAGKARKS